MKERRKYNRIAIPLPVRLETLSLQEKTVLDLVSKDISASGTFIVTMTSFPEETRFILDFTLPSYVTKVFKDIRSLKGYTGSLVRSTPHGIAIQFDKECQIDSLKVL
jgi:hypothetical protein